MDRHIDLILSGKRAVGQRDFLDILWPTQIPGLTGETIDTYEEREEVSSAVQRFHLMYDGLTRAYLDRLSKLWRVCILVYRENPLYLLSCHHGISCRSGRRLEHEDLTFVILPLWTQRFVDNLSSLILHPFFSSRQNGAFLRLALQFAVAYRCNDNRVWDISALLSQAGVHCPALSMLSDEMARHGATRPVGGAGGRILKVAATNVYDRLSSICSRFDGGMLSVEARFLLQLGTGGRREAPSTIRGADLPANEPRHVFPIATDDLEFLYKAADSVVSHPPSKNETSKACARYCGRKRLPQIHGTNMKLHFQNAYGHELDLLQCFRDRMAGLSLEAPRALTMQQHPMHYSLQGPFPPPQQQPSPLTAFSYGQMRFQGQYHTGAWPSQVTLSAGGHGAHSGASTALQPPPQSIPTRDENAPTSNLEHYPDAFLPSHHMAVGGALEGLQPYAPQEQALMLLLQNNGYVGEH
ncbi:unnamed protein product [Clonostachys rosea f. rosea IK726]|jgi:hypothetical protein|uniref:Uncharacterized protein n=1 Tax=Clonostachys rosea f. rosea IK726 TaxID=1349383 RepID=A0ACA9UHU8_BIOOC|nr:unnamed protein product [Clonostachys rosea f. rosea IK726]